MHSIKDIRSNIDLFKKKISERNTKINFDELLALDKEYREIIQQKEKLEHDKKQLSKSKDEKNFSKSKEISNKILELEKQLQNLKKNLDNILNIIPNIAHSDVPIGKDETANKLIRKHGEISKFNFKVKSHTEIGELTKSIDFNTAAKLSGSRYVMLKNNYAKLERALINFMLDIHTEKFGYTEISPPLIVNENIMFGTGQLPKFEEDQFEVKIEEKERKFLIPTAEVVLTNIVRDEVIEVKELPLRFVAGTPCFRKEAGSYGKDTKGMIRQHQFYKVELVSIVDPKNCQSELDRMLSCAEEILKLLKLPYQVTLLSSGDMGFSAEKTYDIEVWMPSENKYREISSCSSCGVFQARRMNAKFKDGKDKQFLGTLNGSGLAVGRLLIAIIENFQNADGTISIPEVLKKYMGNSEKI